MKLIRVVSLFLLLAALPAAYSQSVVLARERPRELQGNRQRAAVFPCKVLI